MVSVALPAAAFAPAAEAERLFPTNWPLLEASPPSVLSADDADLYARIFAVQEAGRWAVADRLIRSVEDPVLMGHVLHQRFMHPTAYRSRFPELAAWLERFADHPGAREIYRLANARRPKGAPPPPPPVAAPASVGVSDEEAELPYRRQSGAQFESAAGRAAAGEIERLLRRGERGTAVDRLAVLSRRSDLPRQDYDQLRARIAASFLMGGDDETALALAGAAARRSREAVPAADWVAGIAAWRQRRYDEAAQHFEALGSAEGVIPWSRSAGAFWAARAHLVARRPERVTPLLERAADEPRTFYGILASRLLGRGSGLVWDDPPLTDAEVEVLLERPAIQRAVALQQIGQTERADLEMRQAYLTEGPGIAPSLLGLASRLGMPLTQVGLAQVAPLADGRLFAASLYPLPPWQPKGGFELDRALLFAFMRQESGFNARARSSAGARGLMQLMPATASYVAGDSSLSSGSRHKLMDPEYNMMLGQKYLRYLIDNPDIRGNLIYLAVAYNAGPGNLRKWQKAIGTDDPLLFIESLPSHETRNLVVRVLTNYWLYRLRFRQDAPSLDALATGDWPHYVDLETDDRALRHARN